MVFFDIHNNFNKSHHHLDYGPAISPCHHSQRCVCHARYVHCRCRDCSVLCTAAVTLIVVASLAFVSFVAVWIGSEVEWANVQKVCAFI